MKSIAITNGYGLEHITVTEIAVPLIKANEVLVKVDAVSLNYLDTMTAKGIFNASLPHTLGSDAVGVVQEVGVEVTEFKVGDKVATHFIQGWQAGDLGPFDADTRLGVSVPGVFSEYIALPESSFIKIPTNLSVQEAATLPIAGLTAWESLVNIGGLKAGQTVLLQGTGGISVFALQFAKAMGARVIITSSSDEKLARAKAMGADSIVNYKTDPNWQDTVLALTDGRGVDLVLEVVGAELNQTLQYLALNGKIVIVGFLSGTKVDLDLFNVLKKNATIAAVQVASKASFLEMNKAIELNDIRPVVDRSFELSEAAEAFRYLEAGKHFGKIVINF